VRARHRGARGAPVPGARGDGLRDGRCDNGLMKVDDDLRQASAELVAVSPTGSRLAASHLDPRAARQTLRQHTGVKVSVTTVARMLSDLGARWGLARPIVLCPWSKARKARRLRSDLQRSSITSPLERLLTSKTRSTST